MKDKKEFYNLLVELDGQPLSEYKQLVGDFDFSRYVVKCSKIDSAGEDAALPVFRVRVPQTIAEIPEHLFDSPVRRTATEDLLLRRLSGNIETIANYDHNGISRRHILSVSPGQQILPRNALKLTKEYIEVCIQIVLPVRNAIDDGGTFVAIDGEMAQEIFFEDLPKVIIDSLLYCNINTMEAVQFVNNMEDATHLRQHLGVSGQICFVAEGAMVSRISGQDTPDYERLSSVEIDGNLIEEVKVPHGGTIRGVGIPHGLTLILGESDSGRVGIMDAISQGIYNHIPGDGRESVVTVSDAVNICTEAGRSIQQVDISAFASELSDGGNPSLYSTPSAGSFVSQAASTVEALEAGARVLLYDECTSSSTFLSADTRVSPLLGKSSHNTLAARARQMVDEMGVSIVVAGNSLVAEFIPVADKIFKVEGFRLTDITEEAKMLGIQQLEVLNDCGTLSSTLSRSRWVMPSSIDPSVGREDLVIFTDSEDYLQFGRSIIDLSEINQVAGVDQARTIGFALYYAKLRYMDEGYPLREILDLLDRDLSNEGIDALVRDMRGDLARPRRYEVAAALNRLPTFRVSHVTK